MRTTRKRSSPSSNVCAEIPGGCAGVDSRSHAAIAIVIGTTIARILVSPTCTRSLYARIGFDPNNASNSRGWDVETMQDEVGVIGDCDAIVKLNLIRFLLKFSASS